MKKIVLLGSTGSIGVNALRVISQLPKEDFRVVGLATNSRVDLLAEQIKKFKPRAVCVSNPEKTTRLKRISRLNGIRVYEGAEGLRDLAGLKEADLVVMSVLGNASLLPLIKAIEAGKTIALASKEPLVSAGRIIMEKARRHKAQIIPVDSEHSAVFQCLRGRKAKELRKIYLTGTGGPLRRVARSRFDKFSPAAVTRHPKWKMGKKISVDSATLMNKGLEVIEAMWLFGVSDRDIKVLIHPEAVVHSMVELRDGTILAQMGVPDMRLPIQYALTYPERRDENSFRFDFTKLNKLTFHLPDRKKFPCLALAYVAARIGGTYPAVLNAANEEAVGGYLKRKLKFTAIPQVIEKVMERHKVAHDPGLREILDVDSWAREEVKRFIR